jgi:hypothetical protein
VKRTPVSSASVKIPVKSSALMRRVVSYGILRANQWNCERSRRIGSKSVTLVPNSGARATAVAWGLMTLDGTQ